MTDLSRVLRTAAIVFGLSACSDHVASSARATDDGGSASCPMMCEGTCTDGRCLVALAVTPSPDDITVDSTNVYFTSCLPTGAGGMASRVPIVGGSPMPVASGSGCPASLALGGASLYVSGLQEGDIASVPLSGGPLTTVTTSPDKPTGIAVGGSDIYWATQGGTIVSMSLSGGSQTVLASCPRGCTRPVANGSSVFWGDSTAGTIQTLSRDGGAPVTLINGLEGVGAMAISEDRLYFASGYLLGQVSIRGGAAASVGLPTGAPVGAIAVDDTSVYFTSWGSVWKIAFTDVQPTQIATNQGDPNAIAVDGTSVYWTNADAWPDGGCCGQVMKLTPK